MPDHKKKKKSPSYRAGGTITADKAKEILSDGTVNGKALTKKQKSFFGFVASDGKPTKLVHGGTATRPDRPLTQVEFREDEDFLRRQDEDISRESAVRTQPVVTEAKPITVVDESINQQTGDINTAALTGIGSAISVAVTSEQAKKKRLVQEKLTQNIEAFKVSGPSDLALLKKLENEEKQRQASFEQNFNQTNLVGTTALSGAATGASTGSSAGPVGALVGTFVGGIAGAAGGSSRADILRSEEATRKKTAEQEITDLRARISKEREGDESFGFVKGGPIRGKGTGTSDSIHGKLRAGSFVVPAKNSGIAAEIRTEVLGKVNTKAKLRGGGGVDVKVSDGEYVFTPQEVKKITKAGINLDLLAPNANDKLNLQEGGTVISRDTIKRIEDRVALLRVQGKTDEAAKVQSQLNQVKTTFREQRTASINKAINQRVKSLSNQLRKSTNKSESDRLREQLDKAKKLQDEAEVSTIKMERGSGEQKVRVGKENTFSAEDILRFEKNLGVAVAEADVGVGTVIEETPVTPVVPVAAPARKDTPVTITGRRSLAEIAQAERELFKGKTPILTPKEIKTGVTSAEEKPLVAIETVEDIRKRQALPLGKTDDKNLPSKGVNLADVASIAQVGTGLSGLIAQGKRPEGKRPIELERLQAQAEGLESQFKFPIKQELRDISSQERALKEFAVQTGGGSVGGIFAKAAIAGTQAQKQRASLRERKALAEGRVADEFSFRKLGLAGIFAQNVQTTKRQLFQDKLTAFKENQAASANLLQTGIANIVGSQQSKEAKRRERERKGQESKKDREFILSLANVFGKSSTEPV